MAIAIGMAIAMAMAMAMGVGWGVVGHGLVGPCSAAIFGSGHRFRGIVIRTNVRVKGEKGRVCGGRWRGEWLAWVVALSSLPLFFPEGDLFFI